MKNNIKEYLTNYGVKSWTIRNGLVNCIKFIADISLFFRPLPIIKSFLTSKIVSSTLGVCTHYHPKIGSMIAPPTPWRRWHYTNDARDDNTTSPCIRNKLFMYVCTFYVCTCIYIVIRVKPCAARGRGCPTVGEETERRSRRRRNCVCVCRRQPKWRWIHEKSVRASYGTMNETSDRAGEE